MKKRRLLDDCFLHDRDRLTHAETLGIIRDRLSPLADTETVPLDGALGRFLAEPVIAPRNVPLHDNAAVDGYAFTAAHVTPAKQSFEITVRIAAGDLSPPGIRPGTTARIFTGATVPEGADTVAMQEDCVLSPDGRTVELPLGLKPGANLRRAGEDLHNGDSVLDSGERLRPQDIAALASIGIGNVRVFTKLRIALFSTGNEIIEPGTAALESGQVFDSNRSMLKSLCNTLPTAVTDFGILADDPAVLEDTIAQAASDHDLILVTGGASRGEEDHVVETIDRLGQRHLWQIAIKPGRPMSFGQVGDCLFLGLPGNPVAAFVCFLLYARTAMILAGGGHYREPVRHSVPAGFAIPSKKPDRREFLRGWLETDECGRLVARKFPRDGSGLISGLREASGLIEIPESTTSVAPGEPVSFLPFTSFGINA